MIGRNAVEHPPKKVTAEDQIEAIGVTAHRKTLYNFFGFIAGKGLNQTFETLGNFHHKLERLRNDGNMVHRRLLGHRRIIFISIHAACGLVEGSYPLKSSCIGCVNERADKPRSDKSYWNKSAVHLAIIVSGSSCGKRSRIILRTSSLLGILRSKAVKNCSSPCPIFSSIFRILSRCS